MLFSGINHQGWEVPYPAWNLRTRTGTECFPATLNSNCWNCSEFVPETGILSTLSKRESQWEFCLWKLVFSFRQNFYDSPILSTRWRCWLQSLLRCHQVSEDHALSSPSAYFCLPCYSPWANSPDRFMVFSLYIYVPDNMSVVDISYYVIYKYYIKL